jgi:methanogenic corrinoid protein MtbC1
MSSIEQIPDDPKYTIKTVCGQTGIRPVTLRAWERRHEVLNPHRSGNRYRLYSDRDVAILRWVKNRVDAGITISNVVNELRLLQKNGEWPEVIPNPPAPVSAQHASPPERYAQQLLLAMKQHDEATASDLMREAHAIFDVQTIFTKIINPALVSIGEAWFRGEIRVTTEHFASAFVRGKLMALMQAYPTRRSAPVILVGCAPNEQHEIGSLMVAVLLRSQGYRVEYMGPDIPIRDLVDYASFEHPAMIILSAASKETALELRGFEAQLKNQRPTPVFGYGGRAFITQPALREQVPGIYLGDTVEDVSAQVRGVLQYERAAKPRAGNPKPVET